MGSSGSKACVNESTTALSSKRPRPSRVNTWLFQSSCLGARVPSGSRQREKESGGSQSETESVELKIECDREEKDEVACISNNDELDGWGDASITSMNGNGTGSSSSRSSSAPSRFLSRFSFIPGNLSFRLSRAASLGSSRGCSTDDRIDSQHGTTSINFPDNLQEIQARDDGVGNNRVGGTDGIMYSPRAINELDNPGTRVSDRRIGAREPVERNVRFSRTLSVGRLRDRVLRRSSLSDATFCPLQHERQVREASQSSARNAFTGNTELSSTPVDNGLGGISLLTSSYPPSSASSSLFGVQDHEVETSRPREARYHDLLEHRSNFLERRRRIRSQVRALQRLGSRFENLSGHERSCILSGQHRTGRCTCRVGNRDANSSDETGTRASISRIVMLAEALFEVLDEIHQQSVVLSSQPSVSSIGSIPAPNEVVESLPVNFYTKSQKYHNEEVAQCYICLVEYEEGDSVRVLPCHHEFHRTCVDKWLKEIHRVCPLCRGDICKPDSLPSED